MIIYKITNTVNGRIYVGMTRTSLRYRLRKHIESASRDDTKFSRAIRKYGGSAFTIEEIDRADDFGRLCEMERRYIEQYDSIRSGYNTCTGGVGCTGVTRSPEFREKLRRANLGKKASAETRERMREINKARWPLVAQKMLERAKEGIARRAAERMAVLCGPEHKIGDNLRIERNGRASCRACHRRSQKQSREMRMAA